MAGRMKVNRATWLLICTITSKLSLPAGAEDAKTDSPDPNVLRTPRTLTFNKDIAPIVFQHLPVAIAPTNPGRSICCRMRM